MNFKNKLKPKFLKLKKKLLRFKKKHKNKINYLLNFSAIVLIYGILTNFALGNILPQTFRDVSFLKEICRSIGWGFVWYVLKVELPDIIKSCKPIKEAVRI